MSANVPMSPRARGSQTRPATDKRTYQIMVRVNATELAELETRRAVCGVRELSTYVRQAALAHHPLAAAVPELNRAAWLDLAARLATLQELARCVEAALGRQRGGLGALVGRGRLEEQLRAYVEESRALLVAIQALRRSLLGSDGRRA